MREFRDGLSSHGFREFISFKTKTKPCPKAVSATADLQSAAKGGSVRKRREVALVLPPVPTFPDQDGRETSESQSVRPPPTPLPNNFKVFCCSPLSPQLVVPTRDRGSYPVPQAAH